MAIYGYLVYPNVFVGIVMMIKNPELLKKRLNAKEQQAEQSLVIKLSGLMFILGFIIAKRIRNEEIVLEKDLNGYIEYKKKVKYKIIPFLW